MAAINISEIPALLLHPYELPRLRVDACLLLVIARLRNVAAPGHRYDHGHRVLCVECSVLFIQKGVGGVVVSQCPGILRQSPSILGRPKFRGLVLGSIEADFRK